MSKLCILRVGSYPTDQYNKVGYHGYALSYSTRFRSIYMVPRPEGNPLMPMSDNQVYLLRDGFEPHPRRGTLWKKGMFHLRRVVTILKISLQVLDATKWREIDAVHIHSPMYYLLALYGKIRGLPVYITFHGADYYIVKDSRIYKFAGQIFNAVFAISPRMVQGLSLIHSCEVIKVVNGIDLELFNNRGLDRRKQILMVSSFKPQKGHRYAIDGFKRFLQLHPDYRLILVGEGSLKDETIREVESMGLAHAIEFRDYMPSVELAQLYNDSEVFLLTSLYEGFPKVLLEGLSSGCKVATTKVDSVGDVLGDDYPYYIDPESSESVYTTLDAIVRADAADFMSYEELAKGYCWSDVHKPYESRYIKDMS